MKSELMRLLKLAGLCVLFCAFIASAVMIFLRTSFLSEWRAYLYRLLALDIICCVILLIVCVSIVVKWKMVFGLELSSLVMCIGFSTVFMALFFSLGPMPIERSYTIYSLADMVDRGAPICSAEQIRNRFVDGYIDGAAESQKRIDEQVSIGNLEQTDGGYRITEKGERLIKLFRLIERAFPVPDKNSIYPNGKQAETNEKN